MKKNFWNTFLKSPWAIPTFSVVGILVGAAITLGVLMWMMPNKLGPTPEGEDQEQQAQQEHQDEEDARMTPFDEVTDEVALTIDWSERVRRLSKAEIQALLRAPLEYSPSEKAAFDTVFDALVEPSQEENVWPEYAFGGVWEVGRVTSGEWEGGRVYHVRLTMNGMGSWHAPIYIVQADQRSSLVAVGAFPFENITPTFIPLFNGVQFYTKARIEGIEAPETLTLLSGGSVTKEELGWDAGTYRFDITESLREVARTQEGWTLYEYASAASVDNTRPNRRGCLLAFTPDGRLVAYGARIPTMPTGHQGIALSEVPDVAWRQAYKNVEGGRYQNVLQTGCGGEGCAAVVDAALVQAGGGATVAGTARNGDAVYVPVNPATHPSVQEIYDYWFVPDGGEKPSLNEFLEKHPVPVFYWQDPLGRWIEHRSVDSLPPVECGKPVIYLYPEQTTDVSVRLPSFIDVTVSEPTYPANGWNVTAEPNGQLTSHEDGNTYGSLYWEGIGVGYAPPEEGFVVKDGDVESFLRDILPRYGLNETEAREFMEFWVPEMQGAPYYRVSFLTSAWSAAAPLYVSPRPQTSIRIFMDWRPLSAPVSIPEPQIITPERHGFTLVEWGGTLWK